jgi:DNA-directed RNA polymerase subunit RPC12/RpoP
MPIEQGSGGGSKPGSASATSIEAEIRQKLARQQSTLEQNFANLHDDARLSSVRTTMEQTSAKLAALPGRLQKLRARGFQFQSTLEGELERLARDWEQFKPQFAASAERETQRLAGPMARVQEEVMGGRRYMSLPVSQVSAKLDQSSAQFENLKKEITAASNTLQQTLTSASAGIMKAEKLISDAETMLNELDAASFRLLPGEAPVAMSQAEWQRAKDDELKGLLFITDHRLIFERKEDVVTGRRLLIFKDKTKVRELMMEAPIGSVEDVVVERVGGLFKKQMVRFVFTAPPAFYREMLMSLRAEPAEWKGLITRVITEDVEKDRVASEAGAEPKEPSVPTVIRCTGCGATLNAPIVKGMKSIKCEYCGTIIRV